MNILVTGVSKGLGLKVTQLLLEANHTVYGLSRTSNSTLKDIKAKYGDKFNWLEYDLMSNNDLKKDIIVDWIGFDTPIHGFVNNAAIAYDDIITNVKLKPLQEMYQVNVFAPILISSYCIRHMLLHNIAGSIVHLSSISVHTGYKGLAMYASTKGALEGFSKNTAREWGQKGIRSNCLVAGFMETEMSSSLSDDQKNRIYNRTSMKSPVDVQSVANTILFLLSDDAKSITGQNIHVDCGTI